MVAVVAAGALAARDAGAQDKAELVPLAMRPHGRSWCVDTDCSEGNRVVFVAPGRVDVTIGGERSKVNVAGASTVEFHPGRHVLMTDPRGKTR